MGPQSMHKRFSRKREREYKLLFIYMYNLQHTLTHTLLMFPGQTFVRMLLLSYDDDDEATEKWKEKRNRCMNRRRKRSVYERGEREESLRKLWCYSSMYVCIHVLYILYHTSPSPFAIRLSLFSAWSTPWDYVYTQFISRLWIYARRWLSLKSFSLIRSLARLSSPERRMMILFVRKHETAEKIIFSRRCGDEEGKIKSA